MRVIDTGRAPDRLECEHEVAVADVERGKGERIESGAGRRAPDPVILMKHRSERRRKGDQLAQLPLMAQTARPPGLYSTQGEEQLVKVSGPSGQPGGSTWEGRKLYLHQVVDEALGLRLLYFPESGPVSSRMLEPLITQGEELVNSTLTEGDALHWAAGFVFPENVLQEDAQLFLEFAGDVPGMARHRLSQLHEGRLNRARVEAHISPDNPELSRLLSLAEDGMSVPLAPDFVPNVEKGIVPELRQTYRRLAPVVNRLLFEGFHSRGLAFILPKDLALAVPRLHLGVNAWVPKAEKKQGRPIADCSDGGRGADPLNSEQAKLACDELYGEIHHPSLSDLVTQVIECHREELAADPTVTWDDLVMFKVDLAGAFTLMSFRPEDVPLMAFELTEERVMFFLCGIFGWTGTPACFDVVTRAMRFELARLVKGRVSMYVDDIIGVCLQSKVAGNIGRVIAFCKGLLGPSAVAEGKTEIGRHLVNIGYDFNLDTRLVGISKRNVAKSLVGYLIAAPGGVSHVRELQRLSSWASRYSQICPFMRPFLRDLYAAYTGRHPGAAIQLSQRALRAVRMMRLLIVMSAAEPKSFTRTMESFVPSTAAIVIQFDASLSGGLVSNR